MWIFGGHSKPRPGSAGGFWGVCVLGVILRLPAPLCPPPAAVRVLCPVTVSGEIKVAVQKKKKTQPNLKPDDLGVFGAEGGGEAAPAGRTGIEHCGVLGALGIH